MTDARDVIADIKYKMYSLHGVTVQSCYGMEMADAILTALRDAGFAVVPVDLTEDTVAEAALSALTTESRVKRIWKIMLKSAQGGT